MDVPWKVTLGFVGVFVAGAVFGGVFTVGASARRFANAPKPSVPAEQPLQQLPPVQQPKVAGPQMMPKGGKEIVRGNSIPHQLMNQFARKLSGLTEVQKESLRKTLGRAGEDLHRLRLNNFEDVGRVTERMYADVSAVLTLEQRAELEKMRRETEEKLQKKRNLTLPVEGGKGPGGQATPSVPLPPNRPETP